MNGWDLATWLSAAGLALSDLGRQDRERDQGE
jgi:hypothetical protein